MLGKFYESKTRTIESNVDIDFQYLIDNGQLFVWTGFKLSFFFSNKATWICWIS